jgi:hypothetical protein
MLYDVIHGMLEIKEKEVAFLKSMKWRKKYGT